MGFFKSQNLAQYRDPPRLLSSTINLSCKNKWDLPHNVIVVEVEVEGGWDLLHQPCPGLTQ